MASGSSPRTAARFVSAAIGLALGVGCSGEGTASRADAGSAGRTTGDATPFADAASERATPDSGVGCAGQPCTGQCAAGRCLVTLATPRRPVALALDGANVYFASCPSAGRGVVERVAVGGGESLVLGVLSACPSGLAVGDDGVYVGVANEIVRVPLLRGAGGALSDAALVDSGTAPSLLDASTAPPVPDAGPSRIALLGASDAAAVGVALDANDVFFTTASAVARVPRRGGDVVVLARTAGTNTTRPVLDGENVYFGDAVLGTVQRVSKRGGVRTTLGPRAATVRDLALFSPDVYYAAGYTVEKLPTSGGTPTTLGTAAGAEILTLAADGVGLYLTTSGEIWKLPPGGGTPAGLASEQDEPVAIATDPTSVYWVSQKLDADDGPGRVMKLTPK